MTGSADNPAHRLMRMMRQPLYIAAIAAGLILAFDQALGLYEWMTRGTPERWHIAGGSISNAPHDVLGLSARPGRATVDDYLVNGEHVLFAQYTIDPHGNRLTPRPDAAATAPYHAFFFGDSFCFGLGVSDSETLPAQFQLRRPEFQTHNFGIGGYGPQHMLKQLELGYVQDVAAPGSRGIAVYVWLPSHVRRVIGSALPISKWARNFPAYELSPGGELNHVGTFATARPVQTWFMSKLNYSGLFRSHWFDVPPYYTKRHFELAGAVLEAAQDRYLDQYPGSCFIVLLYPMMAWAEPLSGRLLEELERRGVHYYDARDVLEPENPDFVLHPDHDLHPSPISYAMIAAALDAHIVEERLLSTWPARAEGQATQQLPKETRS